MEMLEYSEAPDICDNTERAKHIAEILKAIGHPLRLRIVALLCQGRQHVSALSERLEIPQPIISQHLRILRMHELVCVERESGFAYYRLKELNLRQLVQCMEGCA
jgi:DNA-binding transcriptional ArsR family regulator